MLTLTRKCLFLGCFLVACSPAYQVTSQVALSSHDSEFALAPGDTFDVRVFGEVEMSGSYRVAPDGTIDFPLIGRVKVEGLLSQTLAQELRNRLKDGYLRNPQVSIAIKEQASKKIIVIGQVAKPGTFAYSPSMSIVEAITVAGGFTPMAAKNDTTITRVEDGRKTSFRVPVSDISEGKASNYFLRPGDIILVPERLF